MQAEIHPKGVNIRTLHYLNIKLYKFQERKKSQIGTEVIAKISKKGIFHRLSLN